jgi:predicted Zn-dependent protease
MWRAAAVVGVFVVLVVGSVSCTTLDAVTGESVYNLYTIEDDIQLGQTAVAANLKELTEGGAKVNADPARLKNIEGIARRIVAVSDLPQLPYEVVLVHTGIVNACAFPGGKVMVFEGLYDPKEGLVADDDELAAVIAHEIAHVNCRHATERLSKIMTAAAVAEVAAAVAEHKEHEQTAAAIRALFTVGAALWIPVYSREDEYEADRVGLFYMAKAGFDPRAAPRIWKRVAEREKSERGVLMSIFATHPENKARYEALQKLLPYAMEEYAAATGKYPDGYTPGEFVPAPGTFDWRRAKK